MKDTLRLLLGWACNLKCSYCCNEIESIRKQIQPTKLENIDFNKYNVVCISGGEPLMFASKLQSVCLKIPKDKLIVLNTNGILLSNVVANLLIKWGVRALNIGLHAPESHGTIIGQVTEATRGLPLSVRFNVEDIYQQELPQKYPHATFRFWKRNECDRGNEDRMILA